MNFESGFNDASEFNLWDGAEQKAMKAFELYENGQADEALVAINDALDVNPSNSRWHFNKALTLDTMERFEDAIEEYKSSLELNSEDVEVLNCLAVDYTRTSQYDLAISVFEQIEEIDSGFEPCYCNRIICYTEMGNYEKAEQMFYMAQQINENCPLCFYNLGNSFFIQSLYKKAIWCWEKTASLEPEHPQINYRIAQAYWAVDKQDEAFDNFIEELRKNPGDVDVIFDFGIFLLHNGRIDSASEKFNRILELNPDFAPAVHYLGEIELNRGNIEEAERLFEKACYLDNNLDGPKFRLAQCAFLAGQKDEAFSLLAAELEHDPQEETVLSAIGVMMLQLGKIDYAMHCFLKVSELAPVNAVNYLFLAMTLAIQNEPAEAQQFLDYVVELQPENPELVVKVAKMYSEINKPEKAIQTLNSVKAFSENNLSAFILKKRFEIQLLIKNTAQRFFAVSHFRRCRK